MSTQDAGKLPPQVARVLLGLRRRLCLGHLLSGLGQAALALAIVLCAAFAIDAWLGLGTPGLRVALAMIVVVVLALLWCAAWPMARSRRPERLAAVLETVHPELGERITSVVHLGRADPCHGAPALVDSLRREADAACSAVDVASALPLRSQARRALAGALALGLAVAAIGVLSASFLVRLLGSYAAPWHGFTLVVAPGERAFASGADIEVTARLEACHPHARLPQDCWLVLRDDSGKEKRIAMPGAAGEFRHTLPGVDRELTYRVEAAGVASDEHRLLPVAPIYIVAIQGQVFAPPYAAVASEPVPGPTMLAAVEYGSLALSIDLDRLPQRVRVLWKDARGNEVRFPELESPGAATRQSRGRWLLTTPGEFAATLEVEAEHGVLFRHALPRLMVERDAPPRIESLSLRQASAAAEAVPPGDTLHFSVAARDREGLGAWVWEYRLNDGPIASTRPVALAGRTSWDEEIDFAVPVDARIGDRLAVRLRLEDGRRLKQGELLAGAIPTEDLMPQAAFAPAPRDGKDDWLVFLIQKVDPRKQREILAERDAVDALLQALVKKLQSLHGDVGKLRGVSHHHPLLPPDQLKGLQALIGRNQDARVETLMVAEKIAQAGALERLAQQVEQLAHQELKSSQVDLESVAKTGVADRDRRFRQSEEHLLQAIRKLQGFGKLNEALARERLDRLELGRLADAEDRLKDRTSAARGDRDAELAREQERIRQKLDELLKTSPLGGPMARDMERKAAEEAAGKLDELSKRAASAESPEMDRETRKEIDALLAAQRELARRVDAWQEGVPEPIEHAHRAADAIADRAFRQAVGRQRQAEDALAQRAEELELGEGGSLKTRARELARRQEGIYRDLFQLGEDLPRLTLQQQRDSVTRIDQATQALARGLESLKIPAKYAEARSAHALASATVKGIVERQARRDYLGAFEKMEEAQPLLNSLAALLPEKAHEEGKEPELPPALRARAKTALTLSADQRELRLKLEKLLGDAANQAADAAAERAGKLRDEADRLAAELLKLAQNADPEAKAKLMGAEAAAREASKALEQTEKNPTPDAPADKEAAARLQAAARMAREAAKALTAKGEPMADPVAARSAAESKDAIGKAAMNLEKGDLAAAAKEMARAADAMRRAAAEPRSSGRAKAVAKTPGKSPGGVGPAPLVPGKLTDKEWEDFLGKAWGELPGEAKAQLILDLQSRFGDEYQPIIQRYFRNLSKEPIR